MLASYLFTKYEFSSMPLSPGNNIVRCELRELNQIIVHKRYNIDIKKIWIIVYRLTRNACILYQIFCIVYYLG